MKKSRKNFFKRIHTMSWLLVTVLLFQIFSIPALAATEKVSESKTEELSLDWLKEYMLSEDDVPELISYDEVIEKGHVKRLKNEEPNLSTVIFENITGNKTVYVYANPVKYIDESGEIKDKSTDISSSERSAFAFSSTQNEVKSFFSSKIQNGVTLESQGYKITFYPSALASTKVVNEQLLSAKKEASLSRSDNISRDRVVYNEVFGLNSSVQFTPTLSGLKEDIVLKSYTGTNSFSFVYETNGLSISTVNGNVLVKDPEQNTVVARFAEIISYDSNGKESIGKLSVVESVKNQKYILTITVDKDFLTSSSTQYPVYVDPTLYFENLTPDTATIRDLVMYYPAGYSDYPTDGRAYIGNDYYSVTSSNKNRLLIGFTETLYNDLSDLLRSSNNFYAYINIWANTTDSQYVTAQKYEASWPQDSNNDGFAFQVDEAFNEYSDDYYDETEIPDSICHYTQIDITECMHGIVNSNRLIEWTRGLVIMNDKESNADDAEFLLVGTSRATGYYSDNLCLVLDLPLIDSNNNFIVSADGNYDFLAYNTLTSVKAHNPNTVDNADKWRIDYEGSGNYVIRNYKNFNYALAVSNGSLGLVYSPQDSPSNNTIWNLVYTLNNSYLLKNVSSGMYLKVSNGTLSISSQAEYSNATNKSQYKWTIYSAIAPSGYEVPYDPLYWCDQENAVNANCYAYALDYLPYSGDDALLQPGHTHNYSLPRQYSIETALYHIGLDADYYGIPFEPILRDELCPTGTYKVAFVVETMSDMAVRYHWYRQNPDGTWSHKDGTHDVTNLDASGNIIYDPNFADRDNYDTFVGYFYVSSLTHLNSISK